MNEILLGASGRSPHLDIGCRPAQIGAMKYGFLGRTGVKVSKICLGCMSYGSPDWRSWVLDEDAARPFFQKAVEAAILAPLVSGGSSDDGLREILAAAARPE